MKRIELVAALSEIDARSARIRELHAAYQQALALSLAVALDSPEPQASASRSMLTRTLARQLREGEAGLSDALTHAWEAVTATALTASPELIEAVRELQAPILLATQETLLWALAHDGQAVARQMQRFQWEVAAHLAAGGRSRSQAVYAAAAGKVAALDWRRPSAAGKKLQSLSATELSVRGFLIQAFVEARLYALLSAGILTARIEHLDPGHRHHGRAFAILGDEEGQGQGPLPGYESLRQEVWHPNSQALVSA
jgi:hypothetical protein